MVIGTPSFADSNERAHKGTTKIERHRQFAKHSAFGGEVTGILAAGPIDPPNLYFEEYPILGAQKRVEPSHMMVTTAKPELVDRPTAR
jgi:hypothetical protein